MTNLAPVPAWVVASVGKARQAPARAAVAELDLSVNIDRARDRLRVLVGRGDVAIEGQGGDDRTYRLACEVLNLGLSAEAAFDLIDEEWNPHCLPPWEADGLHQKVDSAWRNAQNEPGAYAASGNAEGMAAAAGLTVTETTEAPQPAKPDLGGFRRWPTIKEVSWRKPQWVWQNRCLMGKTNLYTGRPKAGKTTLCENLAAAVCGGADFLNAHCRPMSVVMLVAEDEYGPLRDNIAEVGQTLGIDGSALDQRLWIRSVLSEGVPGGHTLARITDDGQVSDTPFMREVVVPLLTEIAGPVLWIVDPLIEFVSFNRYADMAARALATTWLNSVCRLNDGQVTPLITDHPSMASVKEGRNVGGSIQMEASFACAATLIAGEWRGGSVRQREMEFRTLGVRYGIEESVSFYRTANSAVFSTEAAPGHTTRDHMERVYQHIVDRLDHDEITVMANRGTAYGPKAIADALQLSETATKGALAALCRAAWIEYQTNSGGRGGVSAHYVQGPHAPKISDLGNPW